MIAATDTLRVRLALVQQAVGLVTMVVFAIASSRWLGAAGKGELALVVAAGTICGSVLSLGVPQALTAWVSKSELAVKDALAMGLSLTLALAAALALAGRSIGFETGSVATYLWISAGVVVYEHVVVGVAIGFGDLLAPLLLRLLGGGSQALLFMAAWLFAFPPDLSGAVWGYYGTAIFGISVSAVALLVGSGRTWHSLRYGLSQVPRLLAFGVAAVPALLLTIANYRADVLILGWLAGVASVGVYSVAASAVLLTGLVPSALGQALTRTLGMTEDPRLLFRRGMQACIIAGLGTAAVISVLSWFLVEPVFGSQFSQASQLVVIMAPFAGVYSGAQFSSTYFYNTVRKPIYHSLMVGTTVTVDLALVALLAPQYGALGAAVASALAYGAGFLANLVISSRYSHVPVMVFLVPTRTDLAWMREAARGLLAFRDSRIRDAHSL